LECHKASKHHLLEFGFFLLDSINLGFLLREKLAAVLIIPFSWGSQLDGDLHHHHHTKQRFFWRHCREKEVFYKGSFARTSFTLF
jgi:hypothetical protein